MLHAQTNQRVIVLTGANRGIGLGYVKQLSQDPHNFIFAVVRNASKASELADVAARASNVVVVGAGDLTCEEAAITAAKEVSKSTDHVNVLINNAGASGASWDPIYITSVSREEMLECFKVNVLGVVDMCKAFMPLLRATPEGGEKKIVNMSSPNASANLTSFEAAEQYPSLGYVVAYSLSKSSQNMATRKLDLELRKEGFTVFAIHPGWVKTEMGGGDTAPTTVEDSVQACVELIDGKGKPGTFADATGMFGPKGGDIPW